MDKPIDLLIQNYYKDVFCYCLARLHNDFHGAEDCTQETMLVFYRKANSLNLEKDIHPWLFSVADKEIKAYQRKKMSIVDIDALSEQLSENPFESRITDLLNEEDRQLLEKYIIIKDKLILAKEYNLTMGALYTRISRIKSKLKKELIK